MFGWQTDCYSQEQARSLQCNIKAKKNLRRINKYEIYLCFVPTIPVVCSNVVFALGGTFLVTVGFSEKSETMVCRLSNNHR